MNGRNRVRCCEADSVLVIINGTGLWNKQRLALGELFCPSLESCGHLGGWLVPGAEALSFLGQPPFVPLASSEGMCRNGLARVTLSVLGFRYWSKDDVGAKSTLTWRWNTLRSCFCLVLASAPDFSQGAVDPPRSCATVPACLVFPCHDGSYGFPKNIWFYALLTQVVGNQGGSFLQLKTVMLLQAACTASCCFILITLASTVGISQTLDLVLVAMVAAAWLGGGRSGVFPDALVAAPGFSLIVSSDVGAFLLYFVPLNLGLHRSLTWLGLMQESNAENSNYSGRD